jgi:hypothetical protein
MEFGRPCRFRALGRAADRRHVLVGQSFSAGVARNSCVLIPAEAASWAGAVEVASWVAAAGGAAGETAAVAVGGGATTAYRGEVATPGARLQHFSIAYDRWSRIRHLRSDSHV